LRQSKNQTVAGENRRHIVLMYNSLFPFVIATPAGLAISLFGGQWSENRVSLPEFPLA